MTPVTGHEEYVEHGWNGLVIDWDDLSGTARSLDRLARDRRLLHFLRTNALATARAWPDWGQSSQLMDRALAAIATAPAPNPAASSTALLEDLRAGWRRTASSWTTSATWRSRPTRSCACARIR